MAAIGDLDTLLTTLSPIKIEGEWVFCSLTAASDVREAALMKEALASFRETEGLSLLVPARLAKEKGLQFDGVFHGITLNVHSSLLAVGLTAAVANCLTQQGISANVIAANFPDHVFVPAADSERALLALQNVAPSSA